MKLWVKMVCVLILPVVISGCNTIIGKGQQSHDIENAKSVTEEYHSEVKEETAAIEDSNRVTEIVNIPVNKENRKVIYTANLSIKVANYNKTLETVQRQLDSVNGYLIESHSYVVGREGVQEGTVTARIPQEKFNNFIQFVEENSVKVVDRSITGQDVTEEFVDLDARLKSKQTVESRLLDFMEKAEKTEDLLRISADLAQVQEEIEQLKGRMNYLNNHVEFATLTIHLAEDRVNVPELENSDLNTWDKTKKQFMNSINFILKVCSNVFIFIVGSLPVILILGTLVLTVILTFNRRAKKKPPIDKE